MDLYSPRDAGLQAWRYDAMRDEDQGVPEGVVFHWPATQVTYTGKLAETFEALRGFEKYHLSKGWRGLAYDYWIDLAGNAGTIRGTGYSGATSGDFDEDGVPNNRETDAVLLVLGTHQRPSKAMVATARRLVTARPLVAYAIGHRQAKGTATTCPGEAVMAEVVAPAQRWIAKRPKTDPKEVDVRLIKIEGDATVWVVNGACRQGIPSVAAFDAMGYRWEDVKSVPRDHVLAKLPVK